MSVTTVHVPFAEPLIPRLAQDLLALPAAVDGDLSRTLVVLPSARACRTLGQAVLERSGRATVLLPRALTPEQLVEETAARLDLPTEDLPSDDVRAVILAHRIGRLGWLAERPESAPGLAEAYVELFDELRLCKQADWLTDGDGLNRIVTLAPTAEAETLQKDLTRAAEVWENYRQVLPRDRCDRRVEVAARATAAPLPGPGPELVVVAGIGRLDPVTADLLRAVLAHGGQGRIYLASAESNLARSLLATWPDDQRSTDPLAPSRRTARLLTGRTGGDDPADVSRTGTLRDRLAACAAGGDFLAVDGPLQLAPCGDAEQESLWIVDRIVRLLREPGGPRHRIGVAVNDTKLAARITAQLADAGITADDSHGEVLASSPAGLLTRFLLRAAVTGLRPEPLLELLTHPDVNLSTDTGRHGAWTLRLERVLRRKQPAAGGLAGLLRRARDRDEIAAELFGDQGVGLSDFVLAVVEACEPLLVLADATSAGGQATVHPWSSYVAAVHEVWRRLAPGVPLSDHAADGAVQDRPDVTAVGRLLVGLQRDADCLPPVTLAGFAADLHGLLTRQNVPPLRARHLPVQVMGLVEARLERFDHLIVAGLAAGVFPTRRRRPFLLSAALRDRLGLPGWRDPLGRDAELFLRLLHNADHIDLTWSVENDGQPVLASPFVLRLALLDGRGSEFAPVDRAPVWRVETTEASVMDVVPGALDVRRLAETRPIETLSWSGLRRWRDCGYRFLLEHGFALRKEEEVRAAFEAKDHGNLVHEVMRDLLAPGRPGYLALAAGDRPALLRCFTTAAERRFLPGADDLPVRRLWLDALLRIGPQIIDWEVKRRTRWRPVHFEVAFDLPLPELLAWIETEHALLCAEGDLPPLPSWPDLGEQLRSCRLTGRIDRIDVQLDDQGVPTNHHLVIDYKTGKVPTQKSVTGLADLQLLLYGIALETGSLLPDESVDPDDVGQPNGDRGTVRADLGLYYGLSEDGVAGPAFDLRQIPKPPKLPKTTAADDAAPWPTLLGGAIQLVQLALSAADPAAVFPLLTNARVISDPVQGAAWPEPLRSVASAAVGGDLPCQHCDFRGVCRIEERRQDLPAAVQRKLDQVISRKEVRST